MEGREDEGKTAICAFKYGYSFLRKTGWLKSDWLLGTESNSDENKKASMVCEEQWEI